METIDITIKSNIPEVTDETKSLRQQVRELRKELEKTAVGSDEYYAAFNKLSNAMHEYKDQQEALRNSAGDLGTVFDNMQKVSSDVTAGFSSVNAIMALTGNNSEALNKTMVKLQAGIALVQGMQGMEGMGKNITNLITSFKSLIGIQNKSITTTDAQKTATKELANAEVTMSTATKGASIALKGLKAALISTGIGAVVILVGELINGLGKLFDWLGSVIKKDSEFKDINETLNNTFEEQNRKLENQLKIDAASGATQEEMINKKRQLIKVQLDDTLAIIKNIEARNAQIEADKKWWKIFSNMGRNNELEQNRETLEKMKTTAEQLSKTLEDLNADYESSVTITQKNLQKKREEAAKKAIESAKKVAEEQSKAAKKAGDDAAKQMDIILDNYKKMVKAIRAIQATLTLNPLESTQEVRSVTDAEAWEQVYGTDPVSLERGLNGVLTSLKGYALDEIDKIAKDSEEAARKAFKEAESTAAIIRDNAIENTKDDSIIAKAGKDYNAAVENAAKILEKSLAEISVQATSKVKELYKILYEEQDKGLEDLLDGVTTLDQIIKSENGLFSKDAKEASRVFQEKFNALKTLYNDGIIDYEEYYDTFLNIQKQYNKRVENIENDHIKKFSENTKTRLSNLEKEYNQGLITEQEYYDQREQIIRHSEEMIAQLRYEYSIKPIAFQKEVGEVLLTDMERQFKKIEKMTDEAYKARNENILSVLQSNLNGYKEFFERFNGEFGGVINMWKGLYDTDDINTRDKLDAELNRIEEEKSIYMQEYEAKRLHLEEMLALDNLTAEQKMLINEQLDALDQERLDMELSYLETSKNAIIEYQNSMKNMVSSSISALGGLTDALANHFKTAANDMKKADGTYTKEGIKMLETSAALQIATATINAAAGIATVWATSAQLGPILGPIVAAAQTAAHLINLGTQIMTIKQALAAAKAGSHASEPNSSTPDVTTSFGSVDAYQNQLSDETMLDLQADAQSNSRVYVVETDITDSQKDTRTTVTTATF